MAEIINLRRVLRGRRKQEAAEQAQAARTRHGVSPSRRHAANVERTRAERGLDAAKLSPPDDRGP